jgi:hypothetical protein
LTLAQNYLTVAHNIALLLCIQWLNIVNLDSRII